MNKLKKIFEFNFKKKQKEIYLSFEERSKIDAEMDKAVSKLITKLNKKQKEQLTYYNKVIPATVEKTNLDSNTNIVNKASTIYLNKSTVA